MKQISLATTGFDLVTKRTRKREFLDEMNLVIPWSQLLALIAPHAPAGKTGKLAKKSLPVSPYAHSRINSRFGGGCADHPKANFNLVRVVSCSLRLAVN